jgi:secondary thiamine-phosphate synthase enzyme
MPVITEYIEVSSEGNRDVIDLTPPLREIIAGKKVRDGLAVLFVPGSTAALTTIECEPGLKRDIDLFLERILPHGAPYRHHETWHDDNGAAHLQAAMIGPSLTVPVVDGSLTLGRWQQVVLIDCDTRPRKRKIVVQVVS